MLSRKVKLENFAKGIMEYFDLGHAEPVPSVDMKKFSSDVYYLPMHGVVKESSTTTKLRIRCIAPFY